MMQVSRGPWDSPAVIIRSAMGAVGYGRGPPPRLRMSVAAGRVESEARAPGSEEGDVDGDLHVPQVTELHRHGLREPDVDLVDPPGLDAVQCSAPDHDRRAASHLEVGLPGRAA